MVELVMVTDEKIRDLASIYDTRDTFVSLYLDVTRGVNEKFIKRRVSHIESALKTDQYLAEIFQKNMDVITEFIDKEINLNISSKSLRSVAIFISKPMDYFEVLGSPHKMDNNLVVDTSPYIRPLAQMMDEWENYALVLVDTNEAKLFTVSLGAIQDQKRLVAHIMNKHKKGGWSQMRFNRLRREAIDQFYKKVIEAFEKFIIDDKIVGIVLVGPGEAKLHFEKKLPKQLQDRVMTVLDQHMELPTEKMVEIATEEVAKQERKRSEEAVVELRGEILKGGQAVFGIKETVKATREGKAELLILSKKLKPRGWICEHCQVVEVGTKKNCPYCNNLTSEVDVLEEILEFAKRTDTNIEFVDDNPFLEDIGGVGALLRY